MRRKAFTLAEVLITLGIIGIVAAMTIPTLISKYQDKVYSEKLTNTYSKLLEGFRLMIDEYGTIDTWTNDYIERSKLISERLPMFMKVSECDRCFSGLNYKTYNEKYSVPMGVFRLSMPNGVTMSIKSERSNRCI